MESSPEAGSPASGSPLSPSAADVLRPALVLWIATQVLAGLEPMFQGLLWPLRPEAGFAIWIWELGSVVFAALVFWFVYDDPEARRVWRRPRPRMVELCVLLGAVTAIVLVQWESWIPPDAMQPSLLALEYMLGWPLWASLLTTAVMPAVFEELMFRGLLQQRFSRVLSLRLAIVLQAMLFSVMHFDSVMILPHLLFGLVAGVLRQAAGALWPCMLMHFLWNGHIVLQTYGWL